MMEHASVDESADLDLQPNEAQNNVAGYIKKLCLLPNPESNLKSVISVKGEGRLVELSSVLIDMVAKCDTLINSFHGKGLRLGKSRRETEHSS
jgi:hypothetical protein